LYWHFLIKHQATFQKNPRTRLMTANLAKISPEDQQRIQAHAQIILQNSDAL
jgi:deoxyribodipyrimidine photolyase-related protein